MGKNLTSRGRHSSAVGSGATDSQSQLESLFDSADINLLVLESDPRNVSAIRDLGRVLDTAREHFRANHPRALRLVSAVQPLVDGLRSGQVDSDGPAVDVLFDAVDLLRRAISAPENGIDEALDSVASRAEALINETGDSQHDSQLAPAFGGAQAVGRTPH